MPELLRAATDPGGVRCLPGPVAVLDPVTTEVLDSAVSEATARAFRDGEAAGRAAAVDAADRAGAAVTRALEALLAEVRSQLAEATRLNLAFVAEVAAAVLERTPPDDAMAVLERISRAVATLDDLRLEVRLNPTDHAVIAAVVPAGLEAVADPSLAAGDARIVGADSGAELTRTAMLEAAIRILAEDRP